MSIVQNKETLLLSLKKNLKDNVESIIDNFSEITKIAKIEETGQVAKYTQMEQELFEAQVRAANMVRASESLINLLSNLKQLFILSDFKSINENIQQNTKMYNSLNSDCSKKLKSIRDELVTHLYELEDEYYSSMYK